MRARGLVLAWALCLLSPSVLARQIPERAELGKLQIGVFPEARLDGRPIRLGAGARIYDQNNAVVMPSTVTGTQRVAYVRGALGELVEVWLLNDEQARRLAADARRRANP